MVILEALRLEPQAKAIKEKIKGELGWGLTITGFKVFFKLVFGKLLKCYFVIVVWLCQPLILLCECFVNLNI